VFRFQLTSISGKKFDEEVYEVVLPTADGQIGVLSHHMPLVSTVGNGAIMIRRTARDTDAQREYFATNGGVIEFSDNTLRVLVDEADSADELNESEIQKALERANKMRAEAKDQVSLEHAQQLVDRQSVRLQVANLKRHQRQRR
jgi:F-type H+-transporting ATPase subunit epsilon